MAFGTTDLSTTSLGANQFPVGSCYVPGTAGGALTSLEGIAVNTDGQGNKSAGMRVGLKDGDDVTLGTTTQTKATDGSATSWSVIQLQKGILDKLLNSIAVTGTFWQATQPVSGTFWQATQPVSGTVTANAGTNLNTSALALDTSVNGVIVAQGSTTSGEKGPMVQGAVTTNAPAYTTAQTSPLSLDASGLLRASLKDTPSNTNNFNVNLAASAATVTVTAANLQTNVAQIGGTNVVTGGVAGLMAVGGPVASGASNADNPIKVGGVFNTTQPTVTNGQIVDAQMTARGAQIVATGADTFTVTANAGTNLNTSALALEAGHLANIDTHTPAQGQATMANSRPVAIASDQSNVPVKGGFTEQASLTAGSLNADLVPATDVSAYKWLSLEINANAYVGTLTFQGSNDNVVFTSVSLVEQAIGSSAVTQTTNNTSVLFAGPVAYRWFRVRMTAYTSGTAQGTLELYTTATAVLSSKVVQSGTWTVQPGNTANTTAWLVAQQTSATGTKTNVASSASSVTILASNAARKGAMVYNDSTSILYLDLSGGTASNSSYSVQVPANGFFEVPVPLYTGLITGIWASATGNARVTEFS